MHIESKQADYSYKKKYLFIIDVCVYGKSLTIGGGILFLW